MKSIPRIVTIGGATQDIFLHYHNPHMIEMGNKQGTQSCLLLPEGAKIEVDDITYATGGGAHNSACSFKQQGFSVETFCKIGHDAGGQAVIQSLQQRDIPTTHVCITDATPTGLSCIIPASSGNNTILAYRGANATIEHDDIPFTAFDACDRLYITSLSGDSSHVLRSLVAYAQSHNIPIATNPGSSQLATGALELAQTLASIEIFILNADEAKLFMYSLMQTDPAVHKAAQKIQQETKPEVPELLCPISYNGVCFSLELYSKTVLSRGPRIVVVTNGPEGVYVATRDMLYFHKSFEVNVVNTVGAGDAFGSAFVGSLVRGDTLKQALVKGILNAVSVISHVNTTDGLLTAEQLEQRLQEIGIQGVQEFTFSAPT